MDYKVLFIRFISSLILICIVFPLIIFYNESLLYILLFFYLIIFYEIKNYFSYKKKLIYSYIILSLLSSVIYLIYFINIYFLIFLLITIILFDTYSYILGSLFGIKKILPTISPNKTYFGLISGYIFTIISLYFINTYFILNYSFIKFFVVSNIIIFFAITGDLIESFFKRKSNIKDSGNLIPGHGGFFDRLDSYLSTSFFLPISIFL